MERKILNNIRRSDLPTLHNFRRSDLQKAQPSKIRHNTKPGIRLLFSFWMPDDTASKLIQNLPKDAPVLWYPKENLHLTIQFIGHITKRAELEMLSVAGSVVAENNSPLLIAPESISIQEERVRLLIKPTPELIKIYENTVTCLKKIELGKIDSRPYAPHITLGRSTGNFDINMIGLKPSEYAFETKEFGLYKSIPGNSGLGSYTLLKSFSLQ